MDAFVVRRLVFACAVLLLLQAAPAHAAPPVGDNVVDALSVPLNGSKTADNIQEATLQGSQVEGTTCDVDDSSDHSVWFTFTIPEGLFVTLDIESGGSLVYTDTSVATSVVMTLYRQDFLLAEQDCAFGPAKLTGIAVSGGTYLIRMATDAAEPVTAPSRFRVTLRARSLQPMLQDGDMDGAVPGPDWKIKKAGSPPTAAGMCELSNCFVRFNPGSKAKLMQTVSYAPSFLKYKAGDLLQGNTLISGTLEAGSNVKLTVQITYTNGTPATKTSRTRLIVAPIVGIAYTFGSVYAEVAHKAVKSVKIIVSSPDGHPFDAVSGSLSMTGLTSVRALPPAPKP